MPKLKNRDLYLSQILSLKTVSERINVINLKQINVTIHDRMLKRGALNLRVIQAATFVKKFYLKMSSAFMR